MRTLLFISGLLFIASCDTPKKQDTSQTLPISISNSSLKGLSVYLTSDQNNQPVMTWCEEDSTKKENLFFFSFSTDQGKTFSKPMRIPTPEGLGTHTEGMPKVAFKADGTMLAAYQIGTPTAENKRSSYIGFSTSTDKGKTWSATKLLHTDTAAGKSHSFFDITRLADGEIGASWLDVALGSKKGGRPVRFAKTNFENNFDNEIIVDSVACECCRTAISSDKEGNVAIMYRDILPAQIRDMSVSFSSNNGKTFSDPKRVSYDNWNLDGCPHNGPSISLNNGYFYSGWFTGAEKAGVYFNSGKIESEIGQQELFNANARHIQVRTSADNIVIVWDETVRKENDVFTRIGLQQRSLDGKIISTQYITSDTTDCFYPVVKIINDNQVLVAYTKTTTTPKKQEIIYQRIKL